MSYVEEEEDQEVITTNYIKSLEKEIKEAVGSTEYAEAAKKQKQLENAQKELVTLKQKRFEEKVAESYKKLDSLNETKEKKIAEYYKTLRNYLKDRYDKTKNNLQKKHEAEDASLESTIENKKKVEYVPSPKVLKLRKNAEIHAFHKKFTLADAIKQKALKKEEEEKELFEKNRQTTSSGMKEELEHKHEREQAFIQTKYQNDNKEINKLEEKEHERLKKHYEFLKADLHNNPDLVLEQFEFLVVGGERNLDNMAYTNSIYLLKSIRPDPSPPRSHVSPQKQRSQILDETQKRSVSSSSPSKSRGSDSGSPAKDISDDAN